jgi:hypothetical protein
VFGVYKNRVFRTDVLFIRTENTVRARERAMAAWRHRRTLEDILRCGAQACADGGPSARIADCARMKNTSVHNRRSWIKPHAVFGVYHKRVNAQGCSSHATIFEQRQICSTLVLEADHHE